MTERHPLSERCTAKSKRTGERCKLFVIGGGVCAWHGGRAPQVKAKREARILAGEAALQGRQVEDRTPAEALLAAARDADGILQRLKAQADDGDVLDRSMLSALGDWIDRTARVTKTVVEAKVDEAIVQRQQSAVLAEAAELASVLAHALDAARLTDTQKGRVMDALPRLLRSQSAGELSEMQPNEIATHPAEVVVQQVKVPTPVFIQLPKRRELTTGREHAVTWIDGVPIYSE